MIPDDLRLQLIEAISKTPVAATRVGRTGLLTGVPKGELLTRNQENDLGDITVLVSQLEEMFGPEKEWRLLSFIDNAIASLPGSDLKRELQRIRRELLSARPRFIDSAQTAQVHLFDLRKPVMMCVGQLPTAGLSGFVLPGATRDLVGYFCDSLKYRGAEYKAWSRDAVAPADPPLVIDPVRMTVSTAAARPERFRKLLALRHVFWPVYVESASDADALWRAVKETFNQPLQRLMIAVFGMPEAQPSIPDDMHPLPPPQFTREDIVAWASDIAKAKKWHQALTEKWTTGIVMKYTSNGALPVDSVYRSLEQYHKILIDYGDDDQLLLQALDDLAQMEA